MRVRLAEFAHPRRQRTHHKYGKGNPEPVYLGGFSIDLEEVRKYRDDSALRASDYWEGVYQAAFELAGRGNLCER